MPYCHICGLHDATWFQIASHFYSETWNQFHELWKIFLESFGRNYWLFIFIQFLWCFRVKCENAEHGCEAIVRLDNLVEHSAQCEFNPKRPIPCESCEMEIPKNQIKNHNCIRDLRKQGKNYFLLLVMTWILVLDLQTRVESLEKDKQEQNSRHNRDISRLARMIEQSSSHRSILQINNRLVEEQILRWSESLSSARVTRWGGVISTPGKIRVSFDLL